MLAHGKPALGHHVAIDGIHAAHRFNQFDHGAIDECERHVNDGGASGGNYRFGIGHQQNFANSVVLAIAPDCIGTVGGGIANLLHGRSHIPGAQGLGEPSHPRGGPVS